MNDLSILFSARNGGNISADQTLLIDEALAKVAPADIPEDQVQNVVDYLNAHLLRNHEALPPEQRSSLERLLQSLVGHA